MKSQVFIALVLIISTTFVSSVRIKTTDQAQLTMEENTAAPTYLGCFADNSHRTMPNKLVENRFLTIANCAVYCADYAYFAVQYGIQCFCANNKPTQTATNCNMGCGGNSQEMCGGFWANSVYATGVTPKAKAAPNYLGCFTDYPIRTLPMNYIGNPSMNVEMCADNCADYAYFAVQFGAECYCGNDRPTRNAANCNMACAGNNQQMCGGFWAHSLYSTGVTPKAKPAPTYLGCFVDYAIRTFPNKLVENRFLTIAQCAVICADYAYFATQYGIQCFCSNTKPTQTATNCNMACPGNSQEMCGGFWANSVYATGVTPKTTAAPTYLGCFTDYPIRTLPMNFLTSTTQNVLMCADNCAGYDYFAVQYGAECYCGNTKPTQTATNCNMACSGNSQETCGGFWAHSLYSNEARKHTKDTKVIHFTDHGCFVDNPNRVLPYRFVSDGAMTRGKCDENCNGYAYFGLEYGSQCFCGDTKPSEKSTNCNFPCAGNNQETCGGSWAIQIFTHDN